MTGLSLITAVAIGAVIGIVGRVLTRRGRNVPLWLPVAAGVAAAVLATVIARMANSDRPGPTLLEIVLQVLFAAAGVAVVAVTADRPSSRSSARRFTREDAR
ncbi:GlsB/YeaQ/YmgE family stress response membrane protein [Actinoplanes derwentensis]|uniref:Transglycosylase associated protein n=1 Tax=Actinoplanes derwentensis TaxID=113562 RepID=A0A1H1Z2L4_9ACTN|nr:GlsB/YeaQ/YmgE family stress response membrane protein [Actinoplanes derwentensis]GID81397.1 hypothetical protein Ade03nite_03210 [Actinoplanes derwentensis]SDT27837.1 hypothetical protein SAMN04489716_3105 [Actinoplanes derwentensis]